MKKLLPTAFVLLLFTALFLRVQAAVPSVSVSPSVVIQGDPVLFTIDNVKSIASVKSASFNGKKQNVLMYRGKPSVIVGIDLNQTPGDYVFRATLSNGGAIKKTITVAVRSKEEIPLGIPEKLGGNTTSSQANLVSSLTRANNLLKALKTGAKAFWTDNFRFPLSNAVVTDTYGYLRQTGAYDIAHKGTDFHADKGTPVLAMNRGVVRFAGTTTVYGKMIAVDHGLGILTIYMHLSKIRVNVGELVKPGQIIGLSGDTGYAESPHLHVSVWLNKISVDPLEFLALLGK